MKNVTWVRFRNQHGRAFEDRIHVPFHSINTHEAGGTGLKVSARHDFETLLYFDIDTHKYGSAEDVIILCQIVRDLFPGMPPFVCNERGGSGWDRHPVEDTGAHRLLTRGKSFLPRRRMRGMTASGDDILRRADRA